MKMDRLLAMTILLLNRGRVRATELAERFEVSTKTIYRDLETLNQSGIPIVAHQGTGGGFEILDSYTMDRQFLTRTEIASIVATIKGLTTVLDDTMFVDLLEKVQALQHKTEQAHEAPQGTELIFDMNPWGQSPAAREKVQTLRRAIAEQRKVHIHYSNRDGTETERDLEPYALLLKGHLWYLHAYCTSRNDFRVFRLSRILDLEMKAEHFVRRQAPPIEAYSWNPEWSRARALHMTLTFHPKVRARLADEFPADLLQVREDGFIQVQGEFVEDDWFYGMLLSYGESVKVEEPQSVAQEVVRRAQRIVDLYPPV